LPLPYEWNELHQSASLWIAKTNTITERKRTEMLRQLKVAASFKNLGLREIEEYIGDSRKKPYAVLNRLQDHARKKGAKLLERRLILCKSQTAHFTNDDLDRLWFLGFELSDFDCAWRVATMMHSRKVLSDVGAYPWSISGEKRTEYPFLAPTQGQLRFCYEHLDPDAKKLCHACITVGPLIPELLAALDPGSKAFKVSMPPSESHEAAIEKALGKINWLAAPKKGYRFSFDGLVSSSLQLPSFIEVLPNNLWSYLYVRLAERLGLNAWSWKLSKLHDQIEELLPRIASRVSLSQYSTKVARWLKNLSSEQRSAWLDLTYLSAKIDDERCQEILAEFLFRLSLIIYPAHVQSLKSLRTMRVPVSMIWAMERWMLSEQYSQIRVEQETASRIPVPVTLRRSILLDSSPELD